MQGWRLRRRCHQRDRQQLEDVHTRGPASALGHQRAHAGERSHRHRAATGPVTFAVKTPQGNFSFSSQNLPFGVSQTFLKGSAYVAQTSAPLHFVD